MRLHVVFYTNPVITSELLILNTSGELDNVPKRKEFGDIERDEVATVCRISGKSIRRIVVELSTATMKR